MRILSLATLYILLPIISAEPDKVDRQFNDITIHASVGTLPLKYSPMSEQDENASIKASDILGLIQLAPNIDPFKFEAPSPIGIDIPFLWLKGVAYLRNFVIAGVKKLQVESVALRLINLRSDLNITIPHIYFESEFNLQATISYLPVIFRCHLSGTFYDMCITVSSGGKQAYIPPTGKVLQIDSAELNVHIKDAKFNFTRMSVGGEKEDVGNPVTQLFKDGRRAQSSVYDNMLKTALGFINKELSKISIDALIG